MSGDAIEAIGTAAALLAEHSDPTVQAVGGWLLDAWPAELIEALTGLENSVGRSVRDEILLARRNTLERKLGETASPVPLAKELERYYTDVWLPRDRVKAANPYPAGDRRAALWQIYRLRPQPVSLQYLRVILRNSTMI
jgi:hypothetical protein